MKRVSRLAGGAFVVLAALIAVSSAPRGNGKNLQFRADALDYAAVAHRLAAGEPPAVPLGNRTYPTRFPLGFPMLLAPAVFVGMPPHELWRVSATAAVAGVGVTYVAALFLTGALSAAVSALLLGLSPLYLQYATMTMSEATATALTAVWALFLVRRRSFVGVGVVAGFACTVRLTGVVLLLGGAAAALRTGRRGLVQFGAGAALGLLPGIVAVANGWSTPLGGYALWMPEFYGTPTAAFSLSALTHNAPEYAAVLAGVAPHLPFFSVPAALLLLLGIFVSGRPADRPCVFIIAGTVALHCAIVLP